jgi:Fur family ferric uptake transcriptional regulator
MSAAQVARSEWVAAAMGALAEAGYRRGGARSAVVRVLSEQPCALSAVEIGELLARREHEVSRASIYRVLEELERLGLAQRVEVGQGIVRHEAAGPGAGHHDHLLCERCGRLQPFHDERLERAIARLSGGLGMVVSEHEVVIRGDCASCVSVDRN